MRRAITCLATVLLAHAAATLAAQDKSQVIKVRLLDTPAFAGSHNCFLSDDGKLALIGEGDPGQKTRWGLWNMSEGKLVRFLSAEKGKGTAPYAGDDKADFGAKIDFDGRLDTVSFSTNGKLIVGLSKQFLCGKWQPASSSTSWKTAATIHTRFASSMTGISPPNSKAGLALS